MNRRAGLIAALSAATLLSMPAASSADSMNPVALGTACAGCHGTDGHSKGPMPTIAGKSSDYIAKALKEFRDGKRSSTVMQRIAKGYTDEQIDALATLYGK
ncbi:MAG: c-type cytochrome [Gammaproteobacteria bacterium]|nr:c-type cytochrome [Gammaproteobacteria bacterium]